MYRITYKVSFALISVIIASCGVEYVKTADLQSELQLSLNTVTNQSKTLEDKVKRASKELTPYHICSDTSVNMVKAKAKITQLKSDSEELKRISTELSNEMSNYTTYTNGKPVIISKMPEWQKIQQTQELFKTNSAKWADGFSAIEVQSLNISAYIKDTLAASLQKANPNDYVSKMTTLTISLEEKVNSMTKEFSGLKPLISDKIGKYKRLFPDVVKKIEAELSGISTKYDALSKPVKELKENTNDFKNKTSGMSVIYSCQKEWKDLLQLEVVFMEKTDIVTNIENEIKDKRKILDALLALLL